MKLPSKAPVMIVGKGILFPKALLPFHVSQPRYRRMVRDALESDRMIVVAMRRGNNRSRERTERVAGLGVIRACVRREGGAYDLFLEGVARVEILRAARYRPYRVAAIRPAPTERGRRSLIQELCREAIRIASARLEALSEQAVPERRIDPLVPVPLPPEEAVEVFRGLLSHLEEEGESEQIADLLSATLLDDPAAQQEILATPHLVRRFHRLISYLRHSTGLESFI
ncbi:MAG: LON peptidase substrate-binding domain-containing protein [Verrucomicrobia bacterium]|nr:LON peptidase substrate-binding domain-containing protein [Verrucomicrobiota bacterium]